MELLKWISIFIFYYILLAALRTHLGFSACIPDDVVQDKGPDLKYIKCDVKHVTGNKIAIFY